MREIFDRLCGDRHSFRRHEALEVGLDDSDLRRAVRGRALVRIRHGRYAPYDEWTAAPAVQRHLWLLEAVAQDAHCEVVASHATALVVLGAPTWRVQLDQVHVLRLDGHANRRCVDVVQHRGRLADGDVVVRGGVRVTSPERTCLDISTIVGLEETRVVMDWFLHHGHTSKRRLAARAQLYRQVPNSLRTDLAVRLAEPKHESVGETRSAHMFWRYGVPPAVPQLVVTDERGHEFARLDFAWPEHKVWLEFDGLDKHRRALESGMNVLTLINRERAREQKIARLTGWRCIRITWADLERPEATAAYIKSVLAGGPVH